MYEILNDYKSMQEVSEELIEKYKDVFPEALLDIWKNLGFGSFMNGFFRVINPDDYQEIVNKTYFDYKNSVPFLVTAFGDIYTWEKNKFVGNLMYRKNEYDIICVRMESFFSRITKPFFVDEHLHKEQYAEAHEKLGDLQLDECYGYVPLLGIGGAEKVENLQIVKTREHIELITQLVGVIN